MRERTGQAARTGSSPCGRRSLSEALDAAYSKGGIDAAASPQSKRRRTEAVLQPADVNYGHDQRPQPQPQPAGASQDSGSDAEKALNCHGCLLDSQEEEPLFLSASQIAVDDRYACFSHKTDKVFFQY